MPDPFEDSPEASLPWSERVKRAEREEAFARRDVMWYEVTRVRLDPIS